MSITQSTTELVSTIIEVMDKHPERWTLEKHPTRDGIGIDCALHLDAMTTIKEEPLNGSIIVTIWAGGGLRKPELITWPFNTWRLNAACKRWLLWHYGGML